MTIILQIQLGSNRGFALYRHQLLQPNQLQLVKSLPQILLFASSIQRQYLVLAWSFCSSQISPNLDGRNIYTIDSLNNCNFNDSKFVCTEPSIILSPTRITTPPIISVSMDCSIITSFCNEELKPSDNFVIC